MGNTNGLPVRRSARVLLLNQNQQLLLLGANERLPDGSTREIWVPTGGGVEAGESFAECAARELFEEIGLRIGPDQLGSVVAVYGGAFVLNGVDTWADEAFFFLRVPYWDVDMSGLTEIERQTVALNRWWSLPELAATDRTIFPPPSKLVTLISSILASGPPAEPVELTWTNPPYRPRT